MKGNALGVVRKLRNVRFQPPNGGPKEKLAFINRGEADLLRSIGGSGKRTKYGVPSFAYTFSKTSSGQGNWNTGGARTGTGSMGGGITGTSRRYDVAPERTGNPKNDAALTAAWQQSVSARDARLSPQRNNRPAVQPSQAPVVQPAATTTVLPAIPAGMNFANASLPVPVTPSAFPARPSIIAPNSSKSAPSSFPARPSIIAPNSLNAPAADQSSVVRHLTMGKPFQGYREPKIQDRSPFYDGVENSVTAQAPAALEQFGPIDDYKRKVNKPYKMQDRVPAQRSREDIRSIVSQWRGRQRANDDAHRTTPGGWAR